MGLIDWIGLVVVGAIVLALLLPILAGIVDFLRADPEVARGGQFSHRYRRPNTLPRPQKDPRWEELIGGSSGEALT